MDVQHFLSESDRKYSRNTRETYGPLLSRFAEWLIAEGIPLEKFSAENFDQYVTPHDWSPNYRHLQQSAIHVYCKWALKSGELAERPPFLSKKPVRRGMSRGLRVLTLGEIEQIIGFLLAYRSRRSYRRSLAMILLSFDAGLRASEVCGLAMTDLDLDARSVQIMGKRSEVTVNSFGELTAQAITEWLQDRANLPDGHPLLFLTNKGLPLNRHSWRLICRRLAKSSGVPHFSPYAIRRATAIRYSEAGAPTLKAWRGVGGISGFKHYSEMFANDLIKPTLLDERLAEVIQ